MEYTSPGRYRTVAEFRDHLKRLDPAFDCDEQLLGMDGPLAQPVRLKSGKTIGNRFAAHPMEGWDATRKGCPTELTKRRWFHFGRSGAKLIWGGEAFAVQADGRANPNQLFLNPSLDMTAPLRSLIEQVHNGHREIGESIDDLYIGLQLTHSGRFARPNGDYEPLIAYHNPALDAKFKIDPARPILTDAQLDAIGENYVRAARTAAEAGFDFVDVKCCHGYLMHELLGAKARPGPYGGSFDNRVRLLTRIITDIRRECPTLDIGVRVSIVDLFPFSKNEQTGVGEARDWRTHTPYKHGFGVDQKNPCDFDLTEPFQFLALLKKLGVELINLSLGSPYYCPHLQRPAVYPPSDGYLPPQDPLIDVLHHLRTVRRCKDAFKDLLFIGSGYSYLQEYLPHVAQYEVGHHHVDFVGMGRMLLSYPEMAYDALHGKILERKRICRTFSDCTTAPRKGMISGCYPLDAYYKQLPEAKKLKQIKKDQT